MKSRLLKQSSFLVPVLAVVVSVAIPNTARAAAVNGGQPLPWEGPLNQVLASFTGPVAKVLLGLRDIRSQIHLHPHRRR